MGTNKKHIQNGWPLQTKKNYCFRWCLHFVNLLFEQESVRFAMRKTINIRMAFGQCSKYRMKRNMRQFGHQHTQTHTHNTSFNSHHSPQSIKIDKYRSKPCRLCAMHTLAHTGESIFVPFFSFSIVSRIKFNCEFGALSSASFQNIRRKRKIKEINMLTNK